MSISESINEYNLDILLSERDIKNDDTFSNEEVKMKIEEWKIKSCIENSNLNE